MVRAFTLALISLAALLLGACDAPIATSSSAPTGTAVALATQSSLPAESADPLTFVRELDGVRLEAKLSSLAFEPGAVIAFEVTLTNRRAVPLQYEHGGCFVFVDLEVPGRLEPPGRDDWTGRAATFKAFALTQVLRYGPENTDAITDRPGTVTCPEADGIVTPLAPGASTRAVFHWAGRFGPDLPAPPGPTSFRIWARYTIEQPLVTVAPPQLPCPCVRWEPELQVISVDGWIAPGAETPVMLSLGQVIDGALANPTFRSFVDHEDFDDCIVNLQLPSEQGRYLPAGPGWNLDVMCDEPRHFIRASIDPWTGAVNGIDLCNDICARIREAPR